jgi:hypothetical protein
MKVIQRYKLVIFGIILGAIGGYLYYYFIGCSGGTCAITSNPLNSTLYGAMMVGLLFSSFKTNSQPKMINNQFKKQYKKHVQS